MLNSKIARRPYRRARQTNLVAFAEDVFKRTQGLAAYQAIQPQVEPLATLVERYKNGLVAARNRGRSEIVAKNLAQTALLQQLDRVADALDQLAQGDIQLITDAGFSYQQNSATRYNNKLPAPVILRAGTTGKRGEIRIAVDDQVPSGVVLVHAVEYSLDREAGWQNGAYHSHRNFVASGLPHAPELWLRLRSLGHGDNRSEWSEPVTVAVL